MSDEHLFDKLPTPIPLEQEVITDGVLFITRLSVPGGWIYNSLDKSAGVLGSAFVPSPEKRTAHEMKCVNMHEELIKEIKSVLGNFNPKECSCDGEYEDGRLVGHACYFHRNEHILREILAKAEGRDE